MKPQSLCEKMSDTQLSILVTGANGFVGRSLCAALIKDGHKVRGAVRRNDGIVHPAISRVNVGEINSQTDWSEALADIDVVIHLAARVHVMRETSVNPLDDFRQANVIGTEHLARSAAALGVERLVFVSSIKVNGEETKEGHPYTQTDIPSPQNLYGVSKWEAEKALFQLGKDTDLQVVIIRPPLIYGAGVKGNFERMLRFLSKGIPLPLAAVKNLRSMIYVENLAHALGICAIHPEAAGKTYLVCDDEDISTPDMISILLQRLGKPVRVFSIPVALLKLGGVVFRKSTDVSRLIGSLQIDSQKIRQELDWHPPFTLQQGLQATADWYRSSKT